ncbi:glycosyltransferase [Lentzea sp. NPDC004782]|uniref:glycosyltransferase n=1 Tax=Lentzea sp. NPDC004782 TaxID=3154458 RepID=UPI0033BA99A4
MKIAMVHAHARLDDEARGSRVAELSSALSRHGHDVTVYVRRDDPDLPGRARTECGYEVVRVPAGPAAPLTDEDSLPHTGAFISFLLREWAEAPPDVVHGHGWMSGMVGVLGGRRVRAPVVQTFHSLAAVERRHRIGGTRPEERDRIEVLAGKEAAHVAAANSDEMAELIKAGVDRTKISVVPLGVDVDAFTPEGSRARRGRLHRVVVRAPLLPYWDFEALVKVLSGVDGAELVIAGAVTPALLRSADVVVCAPSYEPSGAIALEAMACGVPVVATAVGALTDVVVNGVTGLLVPPGRPESLARALRLLLPDDTLRNEFAVAGRDRVTARYSWSRVAADVLRAYAQAGAAEPAFAAR